MAADIEAGIRLTPPYGKSACVGQMREAIAAMQCRAFSSEVGTGSRQENASKQKSGAPFRSERKRLLRLHKACTNRQPRWLNAG
jgi:hypothetical protein